MAITGITARGSAVSNANGTTLSVNPSANIVVGKVLLVASASDNNQTTDGVSSFHTVSDSKGNEWFKINEYTETDGAADDGVTVSLWGSIITTQINTTDTVTLTLGAAKTDKIITLTEATIATAKRLVLEQVGIGQNVVSATVSSLPSREYLLMANFGAEGEDNSKTPSTNFTELFDLISATQGVLDVNIAIHVQYRVATLTSQTASIADWTFTNAMSTLSALYEADPLSVTAGLGDVTATGFIPSVNTTNNQSIETFTGQVTANGFSPIVTASDNQTIATFVGQLTANGFDPVVTAGNNISVSPGLGEVLANGFSPTITAGNNQSVQIGLGELSLVGFSPVASVTNNKVIATDVGSLVANGFIPSVAVSDNKTAQTDVGACILSGFGPGLTFKVTTQTGAVDVEGFEVIIGSYVHPIHAHLFVDGFEPNVSATTSGTICNTETGVVSLVGFSPSIAISVKPLTQTGELVMTGATPTILLPKLVVTGLGQLDVVGYEPQIGLGYVTETGELQLDGFEPELINKIQVGFGELVFIGYIPKVKGIFTFETTIYSGVTDTESEKSTIQDGDVYSGAKTSASLKSTVKNVF